MRGADRSGPIFPRSMWPSIGAAYFATLGIAAALRAREVDGVGQRVSTSLLQGALASVCLNWQRVERPEAPLYWMWPVDARAIEGLYECADGRWVHHWTVRPRWVLSSSEGESLASVALDAAYREDPDRVSMEPDGLSPGSICTPCWRRPSRSSPRTSGSGRRKRPGSGWLWCAHRLRLFRIPPTSPMDAWSKSTIRRWAGSDTWGCCSTFRRRRGR